MTEVIDNKDKQKNKIVPDIRPFYIRYPAGYLAGRITGYPASKTV